MDAAAAIVQVKQLLAGEPVFLAGSLVAAYTYGKPEEWDDADVFCPTPASLMVAGQRLLHAGYVPIKSHTRMWERWKALGVGDFHTNSIKFALEDFEVNLVYKTIARQPTSSLAQVLESFDFGLLGVGYELKDGTKRDMRSYMFPALSPHGALPLIGHRHEQWRNGIVSDWQAKRMFGRLAKYTVRGYDMSLITPVVLSGYYELGDYYRGRGHAGDTERADLYERIALRIEDRDMADLLAAATELPFLDSFDEMMNSLE